MTKNKILTTVMIFVLFYGINLVANSKPNLYGFKNHTILSVSDADMVASAYTNGKLGKKEGKDVFSIIDFDNTLNSYTKVEVPASNSVAGPPSVLAVDPSGKYVYIIETFKQRPKNNQEHTFKDLPIGNHLIIFDVSNPKKPQLLSKTVIQDRPESVAINFDGTLLTVSFYPNKKKDIKPIALYKIEKGLVKEVYYPNINEDKTNRLISTSWHPSKNILAVINQTKAEVSFYHVDNKNISLKLWGNKVSVGKSPFIGKFTKDGKHILINNLFWGADVEGKWNEAPNGTIVNIALDVNKSSKKIRHALTSQVMVGPSPEGFTVSLEGDYVVSANMERSWLPFNDSRQNWFSSLSLIKRDITTGALNMMHTVPYDGILPEALVFDSSTDYLAVATFDHYDEKIEGGSIDFFRKVSDPLNPEKEMLMKMRNSIPVTRGVHSMVLIDKNKKH